MSEGHADPVVVVAYDPAWSQAFAALRDRLAGALGKLTAGIEHVGSTAVPGLDARPIVDIAVVIRHDDDLLETGLALAPLGYTYLGDLGLSGREAFRPSAPLPRHHLSVCAAGSAALAAHLALRDALRADPDLAARYAALKRDLAARHRNDCDAYAEGKTAFISAVLRAQHPDPRRSNRR